MVRPPACRPPAGCAGWAQNPKGPQITPCCHQMGRHPTIWDFKTGIRHRIPARISPWGSRGLNPNFFSFILEPKCQKVNFLAGVLQLLAPIAMDLGPKGPTGAQGAPRGPPKGPKGAQEDPWGPTIITFAGVCGPHRAHGTPNLARWVEHTSENLTEICILAFWVSKTAEQKNEIQGRDIPP